MTTAMTTSDFHAAIYEGGGFRLEDYVKWIAGLAAQEQTSTLVRILKERLFGDPHQGLYSSLPLRTLDQKVTGKAIAYWRTWIDHDDLADTFWKPIQNLDHMADVQAPVSMVGGWSDLFIPFQVRDFKAMKGLGKAVRLKLGPWTHSNFQGVGEGIRDALDWFDIHLKGHTRPSKDLDRILLWVNGADEWRDVRAWPSSIAKLDLSANGRLTNHGAEAGDLMFTYDPNHPTPSLEGAKLGSRTGRGDMRELTGRSDVLVFDGAIVEAQLELLGDVSVTLTTSATTAHHDLYACATLVRMARPSTLPMAIDGCRWHLAIPGGGQRQSRPCRWPGVWMPAIACGCWLPQERFHDLPAISVWVNPSRSQQSRARSISPSIAAQALHLFQSDRQW
jgi:putative CocE/NonD family hydrolase